MTLRARLALAISTLLGLAMGAAFLLVYFVVQRTAERQLDEALFAHAKEEALELVLSGGNEQKLSEGDGIELEDGTVLTRFAVFYEPSGEVRAATHNFGCPLPALEAIRRPRGDSFDFECGNVTLHGAFVSVPTNSTELLLLAVARTDIDNQASMLVRTMVAALLVTMLVGVLIALTVARSLTHEHEAIAQVARRVAGGDLDARVATHSSNREIRQLSGDIDEMIDRLQKLVASQEEFIAHAAHELRSPITAAYGELSLALRRERTAEEYKEAVEFSQESLQRLKILAEDLLQLARAGSDVRPRNESLDVSSVVRRVCALLAASYAEKGVRLETTLQPTPLEGRANDLERMLRNLLENALRHAPVDSAVQVRVQPGPAGGAVIEVEDSGPGIPLAERANIFHPFVRGSDVRATDENGSGLGLAIVQQIAKAHRGEARLSPAAPPGACFIVELGVDTHGKQESASKDDA